MCKRAVSSPKGASALYLHQCVATSDEIERKLKRKKKWWESESERKKNEHMKVNEKEEEEKGTQDTTVKLIK